MAMRTDRVQRDINPEALQAGGNHCRETRADAPDPDADSEGRTARAGEPLRSESVGLGVQPVISVAFGDSQRDRVRKRAAGNIAQAIGHTRQFQVAPGRVTGPRRDERMCRP